MQTLTVKQFRETLDAQVNTNVFETLKTEEWLLDAVGLGTLRNNNLLPTTEQPVRVKDIYEAFLRFDDKPLITGAEAVRKSLLKYCAEGAFGIAFGNGKEFTRYYRQENVPFFEVSEPDYWLVEKSLQPESSATHEEIYSPATGTAGNEKGNQTENTKLPPAPAVNVKQFKSITVSGKVALEHFHELFQCFVAPFAPNGNKVEIQVSFKVNSAENNLLTASHPQYKSAKEAAKQLGLTLTEDI